MKSANGEDMARFVAEICEIKATASITTDDLYKVYIAWCGPQRRRPQRKDDFVTAIRIRMALTRVWQGKAVLVGIMLRKEGDR